MKPSKFVYVNAKTIDEALTSLKQPESKIIAGGQSLVPLMNYRLSQPSTLIDISSIIELSQISVKDDKLEIGSLVTHNQAISSKDIIKHLPIISFALEHTAHKTIRNSGTIGGSAAHADPSAEWPLLIMLLDSSINIISYKNSRTISAKDFFISELTTDLKEDEIIKSFNFPKIKRNYGWSFEEIVQRSGDFALFSAGSIIEIENNIILNCKIYVGGAGETPIRLSNIEALIKGKNIEYSFTNIKDDQLLLLLDPTSDEHASKEYRLHIGPQIIRNVLINSIQNYKDKKND
ncbi:FAD binding domain-containing protein [Alphaproteobacteria bacterium]|nr:FAD binding domain-containing protein [Alphaproteobacteria bacterium]